MVYDAACLKNMCSGGPQVLEQIAEKLILRAMSTHRRKGCWVVYLQSFIERGFG